MRDERLALEVRDLRVRFKTDSGVVHAVRGVDLDVPAGRVVAVVGESGSGKSVTARCILNLIDPPGEIESGRIHLRVGPESWIDVCSLPSESPAMRRLRWSKVAMVFQDARNSLTPVYTVGNQIVEAIRQHDQVGPDEARARAIDLLREVGIPAPERRIDDFPHQMSGGMCQRVMIAMALSCEPSLLIADEPTTALDVTIQAQVIRLLRDLQRDRGMSILLITHDMGVVAEMADEVAVMYLGRVVERGPVSQVFDTPAHPYTRQLLASTPGPAMDRSIPLPSIPGSVPEPGKVLPGCGFRGRCAEEHAACAAVPSDMSVAPGHIAACWLHDRTGSTAGGVSHA